jgi:hypothetical protein
VVAITRLLNPQIPLDRVNVGRLNVNPEVAKALPFTPYLDVGVISELHVLPIPLPLRVIPIRNLGMDFWINDSNVRFVLRKVGLKPKTALHHSLVVMAQPEINEDPHSAPMVIENDLPLRNVMIFWHGEI